MGTDPLDKLVPRLAAHAERLRGLHGGPLLLPNVWDAASARALEHAGFPVAATSSAAVAAVHGAADGDTLHPDIAFAAIEAMARSVSIPVTADIEAGYRLSPGVLVRRLLTAGAVGCNLEDTDHHGAGALVAPDQQADRIAAMKAAARALGVDLVLNARIDVYLRSVGDPRDQLEGALKRGRLYRAAGADCLYPIGLNDPSHITTLVEELGPINIWLRRGSPSLKELTQLGVARISLGSGLHRLMLESLARSLHALRNAEDLWSP